MDVLHNPRNGLMFMDHTVDPETPYRSASQTRKEDPPYRISEGVPKTPFQGFNNELARPFVLRKFSDFNPLGKHQSSQI
jgi:hypothetical protein